MNLTRNALLSRSIFIRAFASNDTAPTPGGTAIASNDPPISLGFIRTHLSPGVRSLIIIDSLRIDFINTHVGTGHSRFDHGIYNFERPLPAAVSAPSTDTISLRALRPNYLSLWFFRTFVSAWWSETI